MSTFLIEYQLATGDYRITEFAGKHGRQQALSRRIDLERRHRSGDGWEVVSLHADSLDAIKETHSRYFIGKQLSSAS